MSNIFFYIISKKTSNVKILNSVFKNSIFYYNCFLKLKINKIELSKKIKFLIRKKKIFFIK